MIASNVVLNYGYNDEVEEENDNDDSDKIDGGGSVDGNNHMYTHNNELNSKGCSSSFS